MLLLVSCGKRDSFHSYCCLYLKRERFPDRLVELTGQEHCVLILEPKKVWRCLQSKQAIMLSQDYICEAICDFAL